MNIKERISKILMELSIIRFALHSLIWALTLTYVLLFFNVDSAQTNIFINFVYIITGYFLPAYFNIWYLMPKFLFKKKFIFYFTYFVIFLFIQTLFIAFLSYFIQKILSLVNFIGFDFYKNILDIIPHVIFFNMIFIFGKLASNSVKSQTIIDNLEKEKIKSELKALKSQINPHFLFNSLNTIYGLALNKSEKTPEAILSLSEIFKYVLYESETEMIDLEIEFNYIKQYIELIKLRIKRNSNISMKLTGEYKHKKIAPLILISFIENAIKHGLNNSVGETWLEIEISVLLNKLHFKCRNNFSVNEVHKNLYPGIGMENVKKRLDLIYHNKYELFNSNLNNIYEINLKLELD